MKLTEENTEINGENREINFSDEREIHYYSPEESAPISVLQNRILRENILSLEFLKFYKSQRVYRI